MHHFLRGDPRLGSTYCPRPDTARLVVPAQDLAHAAVAHLQDPRYVTGTCARVRQFDNLLSRRVGQRPTTDKDAAQLVHATVSCRRRKRRRKFNIILSFWGFFEGGDWEMRMFFWLRGSPTKVWLLLWGPKNQILSEQQDKYFSVKIESATTRDCSVDVKVLVCGAFKFPSDG